MWVNRSLYQVVLDDNKRMSDVAAISLAHEKEAEGRSATLHSQKAKDDITIDWMRHRINALEKQNTILMQKAMGVAFPVPEIVPTRPNSISPDYLEMPSFEDLGDAEAARLGIKVNDAGTLEYTK